MMTSDQIWDDQRALNVTSSRTGPMATIEAKDHGTPMEDRYTISSMDKASHSTASPANNTASGKNATPKVQSCQFCRRRKIRCDKLAPSCTNCLKASSTCIYPKRKSRLRTASLATGPQIQGREEQLVNKIKKLELAIESLKGDPHLAEPEVESDIVDPLGKLVIGQPYLNDGFWAGNDLKEILDESSDDSESDCEELSIPADSPKGIDFVFGVGPVFEDLANFHPPISHVLHYWHVYLENCECLLRLIHTPTMAMIVQDAVRNDFGDINKSDELLMFCFYFAAITSLTDEEVMRQFGHEKAFLLARYELAVKHGLTRARFLHTIDFKVLQALVLYLICIPNTDSTVSAVVWNMTGLAFRIAQSMGVDRDGELLKISPFETELRRRLWYQLVFLDLRASEARGRLSMVLQYDTHLPTCLNDTDLSPEMVEYPKARAGLTDMTVPLMRYEAARLGRRLQATGFRDTVLAPPQKKRLIERVQQELNEKYIQYCQGAGPLYEYASRVVMMITTRTNLAVYQDKIKDAAQSETDWLFRVCIEIMEFYQELSGNTTSRKWSWLLKIHVQWHAVAFALKELCDRPPSADTQRAWKVIDATSNEWKPPPDAAGTLVYDSVKKLLAKAQRRRERHARTSVESSLSPSSMDSSQPPSKTSSNPHEPPVQFQPPIPEISEVPYDYYFEVSDPMMTAFQDHNLLFDAQMVPPLEEFTPLPEWFFPQGGPPSAVPDYDMDMFNTDDIIEFSRTRT